MSATEIKFFTYAVASAAGRFPGNMTPCEVCALSKSANACRPCRPCAGGLFLEVPAGPSPAEPAPEAAGTQALPAQLSAPQGGVKHDAGKPRMDLLPPEALREIAAVLAFGAQKYDAHNWRKGVAYSRLIAACLRHLFAWVGREDKDPESGRSHLAHAACCLLFLITFEQTNTGTDDRYTRD